MKLHIVIGFLVSCSTYQKRPLTFISNGNISFSDTEIKVKDQYEVVDSIASNGKDSFVIGNGYRSAYFNSTNWVRENMNSYYIKSDKPYVDLMLFDYYQGQLAGIRVYSRTIQDADSLIKATEDFFNKSFDKELGKSGTNKYDSLKYGADYGGFEGKWTSESGYFHKQKISVGYQKDLVYKETSLTIRNRNVKIPSFCGTKIPWWYYLEFWRNW